MSRRRPRRPVSELPEETTAAGEGDPAGPSGGEIEVFIAESDDITRCGLRQILGSFPNIRVVGEALDGQSTASQVVQLKPNVVVVDLDLPGLGGVETTARIRKDLPEARIMILASSEDDSNIYRALSAGATGFCLKNTSSVRLKLAVESIAEGAGWLDPYLCQRVLTATALAFSKSGPELSSQLDPEALLSDREMDVMRLLAQGLSNREIAERLVLSPETVKTHVKHIMGKLSVRDRTQAVLMYLKRGLVG